VFRNPTSDEEGGEAELLTSITRTKRAGQEARIIQIPEPGSQDHFTVAYTTADGSTSALSPCATAQTFPDTDGDGSIDPLDALLDQADDPASGVIATDEEQLLLAWVLPPDEENGLGGGRLERLGPVDDPTPRSHPQGWSLPYGALGFRITGLEPGARTAVVLTDIDSTGPMLGSAYWKYGSPSPGASPSWYEFAEDDETGTGAHLTTLDVPQLGLRRSFVLASATGCAATPTARPTAPSPTQADRSSTAEVPPSSPAHPRCQATTSCRVPNRSARRRPDRAIATWSYRRQESPES